VTEASSAGDGKLQTAELELLTSSSRKDRDAAILQFRMRGVTLQEIAEQAGLTRERVRQICLREAKAIGEETSIKAIRRRIDSDNRALVETEYKRLRRLWSAAILNRPGISADELVDRIPSRLDNEASPNNIVSNCVARFLRRMPRESRDDDSKSEMKSNLLGAIRIAATFEVPLSRRTFDQLVALGEINSPSAQSVSAVFGSWSSACAAAEIDCHTPARSVYDRQWNRNEMIQVLMDFVLDHRATTTLDGYKSWRSMDSIPAAPSPALVRQRLGSWSHVMNQVLDAIAESEAVIVGVQRFQQCVDGHQEWR
jgi:predicted transcriptional regulator